MAPLNSHCHFLSKISLPHIYNNNNNDNNDNNNDDNNNNNISLLYELCI
jgi:hypothetical protein